MDREAVAKIDAELAALSIPAERLTAPRTGLPRRPAWAIAPPGAEADTGTFAMAAAAALGVGQ